MFHHIASFWRHRGNSNLSFVHYNDLKADLAGEMRRVAAFLGIEVCRRRSGAPPSNGARSSRCGRATRRLAPSGTSRGEPRASSSKARTAAGETYCGRTSSQPTLAAPRSCCRPTRRFGLSAVARRGGINSYHRERSGVCNAAWKLGRNKSVLREVWLRTALNEWMGVRTQGETDKMGVTRDRRAYDLRDRRCAVRSRALGMGRGCGEGAAFLNPQLPTPVQVPQGGVLWVFALPK